MKSKPKYIWGAIINLGGGLLFDKPKKFKYDEELDSCWYRNYYIKGLGYKALDGYITFASTSKEEVEAFILGAKSVKDVLKHFWHY